MHLGPKKKRRLYRAVSLCENSSKNNKLQAFLWALVPAQSLYSKYLIQTNILQKNWVILPAPFLAPSGFLEGRDFRYSLSNQNTFNLQCHAIISYGDVVLNGVNMTLRDKQHSIPNIIKKMYIGFYFDIFFIIIYENAYHLRLKPNFMIFFCFRYIVQ